MMDKANKLERELAAKEAELDQCQILLRRVAEVEMYPAAKSIAIQAIKQYLLRSAAAYRAAQPQPEEDEG